MLMESREEESMKDYAIRAISRDGFVRGFAAVTTELVQELQRRHQTFPVASAALGRTATMGALLGLNLKSERDRLTIRVEGDGPLGKIVVDANGQGEVRGYVEHPDVLLNPRPDGKLDVAQAVGKGTIYIITDLGLKEPYVGTAPIVSGELAEDFTYYFATSEQIPSSVGLGVLVNRDRILTAGGYMIQVMPGATEEVISRLEQNISQLSSITQMLSEGTTPEELLKRVVGEEMEILAKQELRFACRCSRERTVAMLKGLGKEEIRSLMEEQGQAEVICHFCNETYHFSKEELAKILEEIN
jgi:molecular chaperone Hsp33